MKALPSRPAPRQRRLRLALACLLGLSCLASAGLAQDSPGFSALEQQQILALGPWPPPARLDPSNRVSGQPLAIKLGRQLFRDPRMSPVGYIGCVTCHQPDRAFTDHKARAHGLADLPRNTPTLFNLGQQRWFGWGGASDSLWMASIRPILDARELGGNARLVAQLFEREPELAACYRQVFHASPTAAPQRTVVNVGKAMAAYVETLVSGRTPFDEFRDALQRGDSRAAAAYPAAAQRGLKLFVGSAGCIECHRGPNFSDGEFHAGPASARDSGRFDDVLRLKTSALNLLGPHNDDPRRGQASSSTRRLQRQDSQRSQYRTPSLRNVATSPPYLHDGSADRLLDAVRHPTGRRSELSGRQVQDIAAFLATLTDRHGDQRPWVADELARCP